MTFLGLPVYKASNTSKAINDANGVQKIVDKSHNQYELIVQKYDELEFQNELRLKSRHVLKAAGDDFVVKLLFSYLLSLNATTILFYTEDERREINDMNDKVLKVKEFIAKTIELQVERDLKEIFEFSKEQGLYAHVEQLQTNNVEHEQLLNSILSRKLQIYSKGEIAVLFGKVLSDIQKFEAFVYHVERAIESDKLQVDEKNILKQWIKEFNAKNYLKLPKVDKLQQLPESLSILNSSSDFFEFKSRWLIDSSANLLETENNLIHTILSSHENINILIIDDNTYAGTEMKFQNRRDIGLYCLQYGKAYVSSICPSYSYSQTAQALKEADEFLGPSIIILHKPEASNQLNSLNLAKGLIDQGKVSLYRWNPNVEPNLVVDSSKAKQTLEKFMKTQESLSLLITPKNEQDPTLLKSLDNLVIEKAKESYAKLFGALDRKKLLVLFGSDGGNAETLAKKLSREAVAKGLIVRTMAMDAFETENLAAESYVLFVVSTAGQGEFPGNARETWKGLSTAGYSLENLNYSVVALGDSHYWPRPEDVHYFAKAGKDLDIKLKKLGAKPLCDIGIGNDRDADGYQTGVAIWAPLFWASMGVQVESVDTGSAIASDDAIKAASNYLRGTIAEGLKDESTGQLTFYDTKLTKFHGIYQQDDRDIRDLRSRKGMEPAYSFMIRVRVPGGVCSPAQYLAMDEISDKHANSTIKLTTRQAFQFHGVLKSNLKKTIQDINSSLLGNDY